MSSFPCECQRVNFGLMKKLGCLYKPKEFQKSEDVRLYNKYSESCNDIVKKEIVEGIFNYQFLENKNVVSHGSSRKDKSKSNRKIHQTTHENSIKAQLSQNIIPTHQFSIQNNKGSFSKDSKSKIHYSRTIRYQTKEKQTVNSRMPKNKHIYKESNKQGKNNRQEPRELQRKDGENSQFISTLPIISTVDYDKGTLTEFKKSNENECGCFNVHKNKGKTLKDISISVKQEVKSKSVSTDAYKKEKSLAKRCFCILMNKKSTNIEIPEKITNYSIKDKDRLKKVELEKPYDKINKHSKDKNLICKCFSKLSLTNAGKENTIPLTRKPAVYQKSQYKKNIKKKLSKAHIKAKKDLERHTYRNMEILMPYSKKKFKKSRSKMSFVGFNEAKSQEIVTETRLNQSISSKNRDKSKQKVSNRIEKQYISANEISRNPPNMVKLATPYEKLNMQSMGKKLICKCFPKSSLTNAGKENTIPLTRKPAVYKKSQYKKSAKKKLSKAYIKAKKDLERHTYRNMEILMPYSKKKFKKSRSKMSFVGFNEAKNQEIVTETRLNQSVRSENRDKSKQKVSNRIEKQYISANEISRNHPNMVKLATPYEKLNMQSMGKKLICKCFSKFSLINAKKERTIALKRKPEVYKRSEYEKNITKKLYDTHKKPKQDLVVHNYRNIEMLLPYSKKKFKMSGSRMTFSGFNEPKNQELITKASIRGPKRYEYNKIKKQNETSKIRFSKPIGYDKNNNTKKQDFSTNAISDSQPRGKYKIRPKLNFLNIFDKHYIPKIEMFISRHKDHKHKKIKKQNTSGSKISLSHLPGENKKGVTQSVRTKIQKEYLSSPAMPVSYSQKHKYRKITKPNTTSNEVLLEHRNGTKYKKRKKQDVTSSKIFVSQTSSRKEKIKKDKDKVATKVIINHMSLSEITPRLQNESKYENHLKSVNTSKRRQKFKSPLKTRNQTYFENNMDTLQVSQHVPNGLKSSETPVISKCVNSMAKCLRTTIFNLTLGILKKHSQLPFYHYKNLKAEDIVITRQRFSKKYKHEEVVKQNSQYPNSLTSTVKRSKCSCPQTKIENSECFKTTRKKNSAINDAFFCNKSGNSSKHLDNHFKLIKFQNGKYTELQTRNIRQTSHAPLSDVGLSENIKILKSYPCCGRDHNQPELSRSGPKSVPGFFKCLYKKKSNPTSTKQDCTICLKNNLFKVPPADFCSKKCSMFSVSSDKFESESNKGKQKYMQIRRDKPLFGVVVDAHTMKVTNKDEVYRNLKANSHLGTKKTDLKKSKKKHIVPPAIDLVLNRDDTVVVNGDYMLRALDKNPIRMNTTLNTRTNTQHSKSHSCYCHLLVKEQPIKAVKSDEPKSHHEYCTCCICRNSAKMSRKNHPKNCTCCVCRYRCPYIVKNETKHLKNENRTEVEEAKVKKKLGHKTRDNKLQVSQKNSGNDKLYKIASQISSLVCNIRKVSGHITGFASNIERFFSQILVKPCFCGLRTCKKETRKLQELRQRNLKFNAPPDCVCGSKVCKLKHTKKTPYYKAKAKRKKKKAIEKKKRNKRFEQEAIKRMKRYSKEDASMRKRIKRQDKKAMKTVEKYEDDISSWVMLAENAADVGRFTTNTTSRIVTNVRRVISHPRDIKYMAMLACTDPKGTAAKSLQEFRDSGYSGTLARVKRRCAMMPTSKYLISALESHPVTKYLLHYRDKDPRQRLLKQKPTKEKRDIEGNTFLTSLRKKPCLWLYRLFPGFYPHCLSFLTFWRQFTDVFIFLLAIAVWSPCILCTEFCRAVMCCLMCAGGV